MPSTATRLLLRNFRRVYRFDQWAKRRFTSAGLFLAGLTIIAAVFSVDAQQSMAYQIFSFAALLLLVAFLAAPFPALKFVARRRLPEFAVAGEASEYTLSLEFERPAAARAARLAERLEEQFPGAAEFQAARAPGEKRRNLFDRVVGYPRWVWLTHRARGARIAEQALPAGVSKSVQVRVRFTPLRRGVVQFAATTLLRPDPLGLVNSLTTMPNPGQLLVLPKRYPLPKVVLPGTRSLQRGGVALASSVADSEEFIGLRDYRPGDSIRRIHWRSWAKTGKPVVREYQDEFFVRHALILDTFAASGREDVFEEAVSVTASFAWELGTQDSLLDLLLVEDRAYCYTAGRGLGRPETLLRALAEAIPARDREFSVLVRAVAQHAPGISACICILLAWDEERRALVQRLRMLGVSTLVIVIAAPGSGLAPVNDKAGGFHILETGKIAHGLAGL